MESWERREEIFQDIQDFYGARMASIEALERMVRDGIEKANGFRTAVEQDGSGCAEALRLEQCLESAAAASAALPALSVAPQQGAGLHRGHTLHQDGAEPPHQWDLSELSLAWSISELGPHPSQSAGVGDAQQGPRMAPLTFRITRKIMTLYHKFGSREVVDGEFCEPSMVAVNFDGDLIVADSNNHRVQVFDQEGRFKFKFGQVGWGDVHTYFPSRVVVARARGDTIVIERATAHQVQVFQGSGRFERKVGSLEQQHPRAVVVDPLGRLVVDCRVTRVVIFDQSGNLLRKFVCSERLTFPNGVAVNEWEEIFASDNLAHCVKVFSYTNAYLRQMVGEGVTNFPVAVCLSSAAGTATPELPHPRAHAPVRPDEAGGGHAGLGQCAVGRHAARGRGAQRVGGREDGGLFQSDHPAVRNGDRVLHREQLRRRVGGQEYEYHWADGQMVKKPIKCSAPEYIDYAMTWVQDQLYDESLFPSKIGELSSCLLRPLLLSLLLTLSHAEVPFRWNFFSIAKTILERLLRVCAHIYHQHFSEVVQLGDEVHLNSSFKHFILFVQEFGLVDHHELTPLEEVIEKLTSKDRNPSR
ncbi:hypothetical protein HPB48_015709 [Haemaphysalis longicornis]|uniref:Uncharacterized protein n=1 Tax=Haemaphysalis longicornis TaxID=44386 RepID=A0A9J6FBW4_HAELO|nr:hypothetical protein HPB48_015709 [Haemaphysalis longicornis]